MGYDISISGKNYGGIETVKIPITDNEGEYATFVSENLDTFAKLADGTITEITNENAVKIKGGLFGGCKVLTSASFPNITRMDSGVFDGCESLVNVNVPLFYQGDSRIFAGCKSLVSIVLPRVSNLYSQMFADDSKLTTIDFGEIPHYVNGYIDKQSFVNCTLLSDVYIRCPFKVELKNVNAFQNLGGKEVNIHVPSNLLDEYSSDSVWSSVTDATLNFVAIE